LLSRSGSLGAGPESIEEGDMPCVFLGADILSALKEEHGEFIITGEAYFHGYIDGEALKTGAKEEAYNLY
jgi:hypothetical protein